MQCMLKFLLVPIRRQRVARETLESEGDDYNYSYFYNYPLDHHFLLRHHSTTETNQHGSGTKLKTRSPTEVLRTFDNIQWNTSTIAWVNPAMSIIMLQMSTAYKAGSTTTSARCSVRLRMHSSSHSHLPISSQESTAEIEPVEAQLQHDIGMEELGQETTGWPGTLKPMRTSGMMQWNKNVSTSVAAQTFPFDSHHTFENQGGVGGEPSLALSILP